ncbi:MAG: sodium:solute symporter family protein [Spirochaetales bacterium]|jgi:SSS family solute:Na+ symporter|nr:sodium:solute symporter family protein [Spirochaetales bacterium]
MENVIIFVYLLVVLGVGLMAGRNITNLREYAVAGKSYGTLIIFATLSASFIGGGFSMGNAERVFLVGITNIVALWGFSLKELLVARYIAPRMAQYPDAISVGDIMEIHYGTVAKIFAGIFGFILCAGILGAQVGAMGYVFNLFLGIDRIWGIMLGCGIVIIYATIGGMNSVIWTDTVQFVILAIGMPFTLYFGIQHAGGVAAIRDAIPAGHLRLPTQPLALISLASLFLTFLFGETLVPPYLQRLLINRDVKKIARGTYLSGLFSIPFFAITGLIGIVALALDPSINPNLAMPYVIKQALLPLFQGIVIAAVISIVMSSADSFLNAAAICFSNDIVRPLRRQPMAPRTELRMARAVTLAVGVLSVIFAISIESVLGILIYAYNFWAPIILVPLACAIMGASVSRTRFLAGAAAGIAAVLIWSYWLGKPWGIDGLVVGVFANLAAFFVFDRKKMRQLS